MDGLPEPAIHTGCGLPRERNPRWRKERRFLLNRKKLLFLTRNREGLEWNIKGITGTVPLNSFSLTAFSRDYLLGFRKRKKERRQRALDSIKRKELEQVRQMKQKVGEIGHVKKFDTHLNCIRSVEVSSFMVIKNY